MAEFELNICRLDVKTRYLSCYPAWSELNINLDEQGKASEISQSTTGKPAPNLSL